MFTSVLPTSDIQYIDEQYMISTQSIIIMSVGVLILIGIYRYMYNYTSVEELDLGYIQSCPRLLDKIKRQENELNNLRMQLKSSQPKRNIY